MTQRAGMHPVLGSQVECSEAGKKPEVGCLPEGRSHGKYMGFVGTGCLLPGLHAPLQYRRGITHLERFTNNRKSKW